MTLYAPDHYRPVPHADPVVARYDEAFWCLVRAEKRAHLDGRTDLQRKIMRALVRVDHKIAMLDTRSHLSDPRGSEDSSERSEAAS